MLFCAAVLTSSTPSWVSWVFRFLTVNMSDRDMSDNTEYSDFDDQIPDRIPDLQEDIEEEITVDI